ncbi:unnamed protein product, partial [Vitis vinifera]|uniref:Uncharacterized protein n=1 Tax=Vitis vinifera TaxID=29760 RepID=D7U764_VITVI
MNRDQALEFTLLQRHSGKVTYSNLRPYYTTLYTATPYTSFHRKALLLQGQNRIIQSKKGLGRLSPETMKIRFFL